MFNRLIIVQHTLLSIAVLGLPSCIDEPVESHSDYFLFVSDVHLNSKKPGFTDYGDDTGMDLWRITKKKLKSITDSINPPKFILYTGDLPDHHPDTGKTHSTNIRTMLTDLKGIAGSIPLLYSPGNNDPLGGDYFSYADSNCLTPLSLVNKNLGFPAPNVLNTYHYDSIYGYYSASPVTGLRVIAMNSVMFSRSHPDHSHCYVDTANQEINCLDQLRWLKTELDNANATNEKVYIIMHIPPGVDAHRGGVMWERQSWVDSLLVHCNENTDILSGVFFGHTHMDEIRRFKNPLDTSKISTVAMSCPGISPIFNNNPGFKIVEFNSDFEPTDFTTHYTFKNNTGGWANDDSAFRDSTYRFSDQYGPVRSTIEETISNMSLNEIYQSMMGIYMVHSPHSTSNVAVKEGITVD